jgi:hypothetical protein
MNLDLDLVIIHVFIMAISLELAVGSSQGDVAGELEEVVADEVEEAVTGGRSPA